MKLSLNSYLLSIFAQNKLLQADVNCLATHYQILSIFYLGFALTLLTCIFEIITCTFHELCCSLSLASISITGFIITILFLKKGHRFIAGTTVMIYLHCANLIAGLIQNVPMAALVVSFSHLNYCYFLTKSSKLVALNNMVTIAEFFFFIRKIREIYKVTLTEDQNVQVSAFILVMILVLMISSVFNFYQKNIEINLWRL